MILKKHAVAYLTVLLLLAVNNLQAQSSCGFDYELKKSIEGDPAKKIALQKFLTQVQNYNGGTQVLGGSINFIIPVVVHVIHDNGASNISDAQVKDAIKILNEDFQKNTADTSLVVSEFKPLIADIGVEFRLANIDPNGNCTNGITRTFSYLTNAGDGTAAKSLISWDTQKYYNIWVVNYLEAGGGPIGGYSFLPGTAPASEKEGSIVLNKQFGNIGTSYGSALARATITHETGHFLGLYHTWGIYTEAGTQAACGDDDGISDTPNTKGSVNTCTADQMSCGLLDNVQNYMDYSSCPYMFTEGQKTRMVNTLNSSAGYRSSLWANNNLIATGVNDGYVIQECAPKAAFAASKRLFCAGDTVTFFDQSYNDSLSSNRTWEWTFEGGTPSSSSAQNPVITYNTTGKFKVKLKVSNSKGNDSLEKASYIETYTDNTKTYVYFSEGFDQSSFPTYTDSSQSWYISSPGNVKFTRTTAAKSSGSASLSVDLHTETQCTHTLITPNFDLSAVTTTPLNFSFDAAYAQRTASNNDALKLHYSPDCGKNWYFITTKNSSTLKTKEPTTSDFIPGISEWNNFVVKLDSYIGMPNFRLRITVDAQGGNKLYLDNIKFFHGDVGLNDLKNSAFNAHVFPNPIDESSVLIIESEDLQNMSVELHDVFGRKAGSLNNLKRSSIALNEIFPSMEKGIYFLKIFNGIEIKTISILF